MFYVVVLGVCVYMFSDRHLTSFFYLFVGFQNKKILLMFDELLVHVLSVKYIY